MLPNLLLFLCTETHAELIRSALRDALSMDAVIFIDSVRTNIETNRRGKSNIFLSKDIPRVSVFSLSDEFWEQFYVHGIQMQCTYPEGNELVTEKKLADLGYSTAVKKNTKARKRKPTAIVNIKMCIDFWSPRYLGYRLPVKLFI